MSKRPYELKGPTYAFWYDVGTLCGPWVQTAVESYLCGGGSNDRVLRLPNGAEVDSGTKIRLKELALRRGLTFLDEGGRVVGHS